jgi:hypothetical protein
MNPSLDGFPSWSAVLSTLSTLIGLIRSRGWLSGLTLVFVIATAVASAYARRERVLIGSASVVVDGHSIDSLNLANLRRRVNHTLVVQDAYHLARIQGNDMQITWRYSGYCAAEQETAIEFSIDSENSIPFEALDCFAYDLRHDRTREHRIRPILIGADGLSKKIAVPFLEPLTAQEPFSILLKCTLPNSIKPGFGYYTSTLSFAQGAVRRSVVRLAFIGQPPSWVRVYDSTDRGTQLVKELRPFRFPHGRIEYLDITKNIPGQSARIYRFWRPSARNG